MSRPLPEARPSRTAEWCLALLTAVCTCWSVGWLTAAWLGDDARFPFLRVSGPGLNRLLPWTRRSVIPGTVVGTDPSNSPTVQYSVAGRQYRIVGVPNRDLQFHVGDRVPVVCETGAPQRAFIGRPAELSGVLVQLLLSGWSLGGAVLFGASYRQIGKQQRHAQLPVAGVIRRVV